MDIPNREARLKYYLQDLLHEMCHAFLGVYSCKKVVGRELCGVESSAQSKNGHGSAWKDMARKIEDSTERYLGLKLDLHVSYSWIHD